MKKEHLIIILISILPMSCTDQPKQPREEEFITTTRTNTCYSYTVNKDTVSLHLSVFDAVISGELDYHLHEKDRNTGTIEGSMHGDTLFADYRFSSEGMESIRQVAFLKKDNLLVEGYGDVEEKDGKMIFINRQEINFGKGVVLQKIDCRK